MWFTELIRDPAETLDNGVHAVMANKRKKFTMQEVGSPVSAAGRGEKTGSQASSCNQSFVKVGTLVSTKYEATKRNTIDRTSSHHEHDDQNKSDQFCYVVICL